MYNGLLPYAAFLAHNDVLMLGFGVWLALLRVGSSTSGVFARFEKSATKVLNMCYVALPSSPAGTVRSVWQLRMILFTAHILMQ